LGEKQKTKLKLRHFGRSNSYLTV